MAYRFAAQKTPGGYPIDEVASSLQKCCRRSDVDGALFWASELDLAGFGNYAWKRLMVIASEDIGLADRHLVATLHGLYESWFEQHKKKEEWNTGQWWFFHAVLLCATAPKSRLVDNAIMYHYYGARPHREVADHALDKHTGRGKAMKRGLEHFFDESALLDPPSEIDDPYWAKARAAMLAWEANGRKVPSWEPDADGDDRPEDEPGQEVLL